MKDMGSDEIKKIQLIPPFEHLFGEVSPVFMEYSPSTNSMIYIPERLDAWVAAGSVPAQKGSIGKSTSQCN